MRVTPIRDGFLNPQIMARYAGKSAERLSDAFTAMGFTYEVSVQGSMVTLASGGSTYVYRLDSGILERATTIENGRVTSSFQLLEYRSK